MDLWTQWGKERMGWIERLGLTYIHFVVVVQSLSRVQLYVTPWIAACQAFLSFTVFLSLLKLMSIESVMSSNHLILCRPLLLLPSIFPSIMVFSSESAFHIRWPKYWSFSFSTSPPNEYLGLISFFDLSLIASGKLLHSIGSSARCDDLVGWDRRWGAGTRG